MRLTSFVPTGGSSNIGGKAQRRLSQKSTEARKKMQPAGKRSDLGQRSRRTVWKRRVIVALAVLLAIVLIVGLALWLSLPDVAYLIKENPKTTAFIELRKRQAKQRGTELQLQWKWRPLNKVSRYLRHAVVAAEDAKFWQHEGVDWDALEGVVEKTWETKTLKGRGGSTITQQLAKNLYLSPSRSLIRKLRELFIARRLEATLSKDRILELYVNVAEWGDGVFGAQAAARKWYRTSASRLSPAQAARLAVALPNPFKRVREGTLAATQSKGGPLGSLDARRWSYQSATDAYGLRGSWSAAKTQPGRNQRGIS